MELTKAQREASLHLEGPALVLAVPGAGKTTVLLERIKNLIEVHKVRGDKILSITFSKAQAEDMKARFSKMNSDGHRPHFSTIHAFAYHILRAHMAQSQKNLTLIEGPGQYNKYSLLRQLYRSQHSSFIQEDEVDEFFKVYGYLKNTMTEPKEYLKNHRVEVRAFEQLYKAYESHKKENHFIDFEDMLTLSYQILKTDEKILKRIRTAFHFVQVDEAQDNSKIQTEIIKLIAQPENNLFMVADDDQSIYGFRGAQPNELLDFRKNYENGKLFFMEENFRSYKDVVTAANYFIKTNVHRYEKTISTTKGFEEPLVLAKAKNVQAQSTYLVDRVKKELIEDPSREIAILYRNNISSLPIMDTFLREGISFYNKDNRRSYLSHFVVEDILNILKLAQDMTDPSLYEKVYYKLNSYLRKDYLNYLGQMGAGETVFDAILEFPQLKDYQVDKILDLKNSFNSMKTMKIERAISHIDLSIGYGQWLEERVKKFGSGGQSPVIILEALKAISKGLTRVEELEEKIDYLKNLRTSKGPGEVTLSTIHSSKGLEFDSVYIIDLIQGEFPSEYARENSPIDETMAMEEERRLFYVAMTRARKKLTLLTLKSRNGERVDPSPFFKSIQNLKI